MLIDSEAEMMASRMTEIVCESLPALVMQLVALLKQRRKPRWLW